MEDFWNLYAGALNANLYSTLYADNNNYNRGNEIAINEFNKSCFKVRSLKFASWNFRAGNFSLIILTHFEESNEITRMQGQGMIIFEHFFPFLLQLPRRYTAIVVEINIDFCFERRIIV